MRAPFVLSQKYISLNKLRRVLTNIHGNVVTDVGQNWLEFILN